MNEVSAVGTLITRLIAIAIALGAAGTLVDSVLVAKDQTKNAVLNSGMSYSRWNKKLLDRAGSEK